MQINGKCWVAADFPHLRIPKQLLKEIPYRLLSTEGKLLYGAMLDRTNLSYKNRDKFTNREREIYIYFPQTEIMDLLGCGHDKASKVLGELEAVGLIKMRRRGIGRPYEIVATPIDWCTQRKIRNESSEKPQQDSGKSDDSVCGKIDTNNTEINNPDINDPNLGLRRYIKGVIEYDELTKKFGASLVDRVLDVVVNTIGQDAEEYLIGDTYIQGEELRDGLRNLNQDRMIYTINKIRRATYTKDHSDAFVLNALHESIVYQ